MEAKTASPSLSKAVLYIVSLNHFTNDGSTGLIATLFPVVISAFGITKFEVGIMVSVGYLVNMVFQPITGRYSETFKSRNMLALGIAMIAVSMAMFTFSSTFPLMLATIVLLRLGSSFFHPVGISAVSRTYVGRDLDRSMGFQSSFGNLGVLFVFLFAAPTYLALGWRWPFIIFALVDVVTVAITLALLRVSSQTKAVENKKPEESTKSRLGIPLYFIIAMLISGGSYAVFVNFGNILLDQNHFGLSLADGLMAGWVGSAFFGAFLTGHLTAYFRRTRLLSASYVIAAVTSLTFALFSGNLLVDTASLLFNGFFLSSTYPAIYSELSAFLERKSRKKGASFGILFSGQIAGSSILGLLGGYVANTFGLGLTFEVVTVLLLFAFFLTAIWSSRLDNI